MAEPASAPAPVPVPPSEHRVLFAAGLNVEIEAPDGVMDVSAMADEETDSFRSGMANLAESFKSVKTTDAESVRSFAKSSLRDKLRRVFDTFDIDKNGTISAEEVATMVRTLCISMPEQTVMDLMKGADLDDNGEVDFEEFTRAMKQSDFAELVTEASFPAEVHTILEEGNANFLSTFQNYVVDIVDHCQKEVLAAKVPLASFGRIHTALNDVKSQLEGRAQQLLADEFAQLRTGALESLQAQRDSIKAHHEALHHDQVSRIRSEADELVVAAERRRAAAEAEAARLQAAYSEPEARIGKLEADLAAATERAQKLEARVKAFEDDWAAAYPQALAASTLVPPPLPADAPYITRVLELKAMTLEAFLHQLDPGATGHVSRSDLRKALMKMLPAAATHAPDGADALDPALVAQLDAHSATSLSVAELRAVLLAWEGPPPRKPAQGSGAKAKEKVAKEKAPTEGALERALDRSYAAEAHGSRLLHLVGMYEAALKQSEKQHESELKLASAKAAADGTIAAEAEAERAQAWEQERREAATKHAEEMNEMRAKLEAEKLAREEEVGSVRKSAEGEKAEAVQAERAKAAELRTELDAKSAECERLSNELSATTAELQATVAAKEEKSFLVKQTRDELAADHAAFQAKLQQANAALKKAVAAQPTQGGFYMAGARAAPARSTVAGTSHAGSHGGMHGAGGAAAAHGSPPEVKTRSLADSQVLGVDRAQKAAASSPSPPASTLRSGVEPGKAKGRSRKKGP